MEAPTFVSRYWVGETLLSNRLTKEKGGERSGRTVSPNFCHKKRTINKSEKMCLIFVCTFFNRIWRFSLHFLTVVVAIPPLVPGCWIEKGMGMEGHLLAPFSRIGWSKRRESLSATATIISPRFMLATPPPLLFSHISRTIFLSTSILSSSSSSPYKDASYADR